MIKLGALTGSTRSKSFIFLTVSSIVMSSQHEMQRYGKRSEALSKAAVAAKKHTVARATYISGAVEKDSAGIAQPSTGFDAS